MSDVNILKRIVDPLIELLAHKNLKVSFSGDEAMTQYDPKTGKPKQIILPIVGSDADQSVIDTFHGYIDHEIGHVLFTDLENGKLADEIKNQMMRMVFNMCEDPRIENAIIKRFKGSAHNLERLHERVFDDTYILKLPDKHDSAEYIFGAMIFAIRACCGQRYFKRKIDTNPKLMPVYQTVSKYFGDDLAAMESTKDAIDIAKKISDMFDNKESAMQAMSEFVEDTENGDDGGKGSVGEGKAKGKAKKASKKDDEKLSEEKVDEGKETKPSEEKSDGKESPGGEKEKKERRSKKKIQAEEVSSSKEKSGEEDEWIKPEDCDEIYEKEIIRKMKFATDELSPSGYSLYTTDEDEISYIPEYKSDYPINIMESNTRSMTGTIQKTLERAMAAKSISRWHTGYRRGKLNSGSLSRLLFGDDRIFRKKEMGISKDVAVTLLIDCSGSMCGRKSELAATSAFALATVLQNMNITSELIGFTTKGSRYRYSYSRSAPIYMPIFKSFTDHWDIKSKRRLGKLWNEDWMCNNVDGECVQIAGNRLMARPESKKIMIVLSDGYPSADGDDDDLKKHLKTTVQELEKKINIVGIGIYSSAVEKYYKKHVVLEDIQELPGTVIQRVQELLLS